MTTAGSMYYIVRTHIIHAFRGYKEFFDGEVVLALLEVWLFCRLVLGIAQWNVQDHLPHTQR